jgi:hypothetical protein
MRGLEPEIFADNLLRIEVLTGDENIEVRWLGKSAQREPDRFITPVLSDVLDKSNKLQKPVVLDFRELAFMNSASLTPIIKVLDRAKRGTLNLLLQYDQSKRWQDLNFSALRIFETDDLRVQVKGL